MDTEVKLKEEAAEDPPKIIDNLRCTPEANDHQIAPFEEKINHLLHHRFGAKSERFDERQQLLFDNEAAPCEIEPTTEFEVPAHTRKTGGRRNPPKQLPRVRVEHDLPEESKQCPCGCCLTRLQVLNEAGRTAQQKSYIRNRVTGGNGAPIVHMHYSPSRVGAVASKHLAGFNGYLHTDDYAGYDATASRPEITQIGCWAHVRRKFDAASRASSPGTANMARQGLKLIPDLYRKIFEEMPVYLRNNKPVDDLLPWNVDPEEFKRLAGRD